MANLKFLLTLLIYLMDLHKLTTGATGLVASVGGTVAVEAITPEDISNGANILTQIAILIVTLWQLFKKKKETKNT